LRNKLNYDPEQGDEKGIILTILELANLIDTQEFPLISSFPNDLASEITYSESVLTKFSCDDPKSSEQLTRGILLKIINNLSVFQAIVAIKRLVEGETQQKIADLMGCSRHYVQQEEKKLKIILFNDEGIRAIVEKENRKEFKNSLLKDSQELKKKKDNFWTDERRGLLYVLWFHHVPVKKIAGYFHHSTASIYQQSARLGLSLNPRGYSGFDLIFTSRTLTRLCHDCLLPLTFPSVFSHRFIEDSRLIYQHSSKCPNPLRHRELLGHSDKDIGEDAGEALYRLRDKPRIL